MAATKKSGTAKQAAKAAPTEPAKTPAAPKAKADAKSSPKAPAGAKPAAKKPAPVKLTGKQAEFLAKVHGAGETGYLPSKAEARGIDSLLLKKVLKKGIKDKTSGHFRVHVTKAGVKHLPAAGPAPTAPPSA